MESENEKIINRHNELVNEHNKLVKAINSAIEDYNIDKPIDKSTGNSGFLDTVGKGFFRETGKTLFKILKRRVTPQIAMQVDRVLNQWFGYTLIE